MRFGRAGDGAGSELRGKQWRTVVWLAGAALVAAGCGQAPPEAELVVERPVMADIETVFYGFEDPVAVVRESVGELFRSASVGASTDPDRPARSTGTVAAVDGDVLEVEMILFDDEGSTPVEVRCFTYELDTDRTEAELADVAPEPCPGLDSDA